MGSRKKKTIAGIAAAAALIAALAAGVLLTDRQEPADRPDAPAAPGLQTRPTETEEVRQPTETVPTGTAPRDETTEPGGQLPGETGDTGPAEGKALSFPLTLAEGKLELGNLFSATGINPDDGNREGADIAAISLTNTEAVMLAGADITAVLEDGTELRFRIADLPAGKTAMAFSTESSPLPGGAVCVDVICEAVWYETAQTMPQGVSAAAEGMMVTITNHTARDIPELIVYCRTPLGEEYFGGIVYEYPVTDLPANGSTTILAADCIMGMAEVVRIEIP